MGTEVDHASGGIPTAATTPSSTSTSGPKMSMFAKKSGFLIPKNKLSGSLVPAYRGTKKGDGDLVNDDATNQVQRKTKWGPDLTLDTSVRKGRTSAYQARINQISQQLTLGALELEDNEDEPKSPYGKQPYHQLTKEEFELLELEKREIIGELLKLNPAYKAPADYKPLLKEGKVPIPVKEYPGYNFIGLVFGPASDTQKRLEKETGAKIRVYGIKSDTGGKVEVAPADGKEVDSSYADLYVHVSADTFEKVDAAVALIELLVTPVSVNPISTSTAAVSGDAVSTAHQNNSTPSSIVTTPMINQGAPQPYGLLPQGQFPQYPQPWFQAGPTQTTAYPQLGTTPVNSAAPLLNNSALVASSLPNPANMPSLFGVRPGAANFSQGMQNASAVPSTHQIRHTVQPSYVQQVPPLGQAGGPRNTPLPVLQPATAQVSPAGPPHAIRPVGSALPQVGPPALVSDRPLPASGEPARWLQPQMGSSAPQGPNMMLMTTPVGQNALSQPPVNISNSMLSPLSGTSQSARPAVSQPLSVGPQHGMPQVGRLPTPNAMPGPGPMPFPVQSSVGSHSFQGVASVNSPSLAIPRPQQPSSSDFTFQPHRPPPLPASQVWPSDQPIHHNIRPPIQAGQGPFTVQPLMRPVAHNLNNPTVQSFPRHQVGHQVNQQRPQIPPDFAGPATGPMVQPRRPALPGQNVVASAMQPRHFAPHPMHHTPGPFPPRPGQLHMQENQLLGAPRLTRFPPPHPHFGNHPGRPFSGSSGPQQVYDPFSPTASSQKSGNVARGHGESDPEYEDLMASVGVK